MTLLNPDQHTSLRAHIENGVDLYPATQHAADVREHLGANGDPLSVEWAHMSSKLGLVGGGAISARHEDRVLFDFQSLAQRTLQNHVDSGGSIGPENKPTSEVPGGEYGEEFSNNHFTGGFPEPEEEIN
jgi:hypothetical protein